MTDERPPDDPASGDAEQGEPENAAAAPGPKKRSAPVRAVGAVVGGGARAVGGVMTGSAKVMAGSARVTYRTTRSFGFGFGCALRGIGRMLVTPRWWPYAVVPLLLAVVAFLGVSWWMGTGFTDWIGGLVTAWAGETTGIVARIIGWTAFFAAFVVGFIYLFPPFARLVAAPFMALFADRVVEDVSGVPAVTLPGSRLVRWVGRPLFEAFVLLVLRLAVMVLAAPLLFVPVVGQILFAMLILPIEAADLLDWAQSARGVPLGRRLPFLKHNFGVCMGLGAGSTLFLFIPIVNVMVLPSLVVGAVLLDQDLSPDFPGNADRPTPGSGDDA